MLKSYSMYFYVASINLKENKKFRNLMHIIFMLPMRLLDYQTVGLAIGSPHPLLSFASNVHHEDILQTTEAHL